MSRRVFRSLSIVLLIGAIGAVTAFLVAQLQDDIYRAEVEYVILPGGGQPINADQAEPLIQTFSAAFQSRRVAAAVVDELGLEEDPTELAADLKMTALPESLLLTGSYESSNRAEAQRVLASASQAFLDSLQDTGASAEEDATVGDAATPRVQVFDPPEVLEDPVAPNVAFITMIGGAVGLIIGLAVAVLRESVWRRIDDLDDATRLGLPVVALGRGWRGRNAAENLTRDLEDRDGPNLVVVAAAPSDKRFLEEFVTSAASCLIDAEWRVAVIPHAGTGSARGDGAGGAGQNGDDPSRGDSGSRPNRTSGTAPPGVTLGDLTFARDDEIDHLHETLSRGSEPLDLVIVSTTDPGALSTGLLPRFSGSAVALLVAGRTWRSEAQALVARLEELSARSGHVALVQGHGPKTRAIQRGGSQRRDKSMTPRPR